MGHDYEALLWAEMGDLADYLAGLDDADWDHASLCDGWRVRDVVGHMCVGHTKSMFSILTTLPRYRFSVDAGSAAVSVEFGDEHTPAELAAILKGIATDHTRKGISRVISDKAGFTDHLVHQQDIRRPLGQPRQIPEERLRAALDSLSENLGGSMPARKRIKGLKLTATDIDWSHGEGPEVRGPGEAIVLATLGREAVLAELEGDGVIQLREVLAAA